MSNIYFIIYILSGITFLILGAFLILYRGYKADDLKYIPINEEDKD